MRKLFRALFPAAVAAMLAGCAPYAVVAERHPRLTVEPSMPGDCREAMVEGARLARRDPKAALGCYLTAAEAAARQLRRQPMNVAARDTYNFALARVFAIIQRAKLDPWSRPLRVPAQGGDYLITTPRPRHSDAAPHRYTFAPADQFTVHGAYVNRRSTKPGLGAPLVAVGREGRSKARADFVAERSYYGVTALARFEPGRRCVIHFEDPLQSETVRFDGHTYPLAADFTLPLAVSLAKEKPRKFELSRMLRPEKYADTAHIVRLEPYDPNKIPVLLVHGLMDSPATWTPMINLLRGDPRIRRNYQFWYYSYPSGYPYPYSAAIMRRELDGIRERFGVRGSIILVGHSMGALISRLMVTDSGERIWLNFFGKRPEGMRLARDTRRMLEESLIFRRRPEVARVVFIAGPHRGSKLASNWIGRLASMLIKAPSTFLKIVRDVRHVVQADPSALKVTHIPNSVHTLSPNSRFVKVLNTIPIAAGVPYHSIIGDRGRGDTPNSSDGVVPYWSSHLPGAQSELIVPSFHSAHRHPATIEEVARILHLHAK